jgi:DNA adenine methylase
MVTSWGFGKDNSKETSLARKRNDFTKEYADRLKTVQIESNDALKVIDRCDAKDTFFYIDPPYINTHQGHYKGYMEEDFIQLLEKLRKIKGKFLLSSYPSPVLKKYIKKYKWRTQSIKKHIAVTKHTEKEKTEMMVFNYDSKAGIKELTTKLKRLKIR